MQQAWIEQIQYVDHAIEALGNHPLAAEIRQLIEEMQPQVPDVSDLLPISNWKRKFDCQDTGIQGRLFFHHKEIAFDGVTGKISHLMVE